MLPARTRRARPKAREAGSSSPSSPTALQSFVIDVKSWRLVDGGAGAWGASFQRNLLIKYDARSGERLEVRESRTNPSLDSASLALLSVASILGMVVLTVFAFALLDGSAKFGMMAAALFGLWIALGWIMVPRINLTSNRTIRIRSADSERTIVRIDFDRGIYRVVAGTGELATIRRRWGLYHRADLRHPDGTRWGFVSGWLIPSTRELFTDKLTKAPIAIACLVGGAVLTIVLCVLLAMLEAPWLFDPTVPVSQSGFNPAMTAMALLLTGGMIFGCGIVGYGVYLLVCDARLYLDGDDGTHLGTFDRDQRSQANDNPKRRFRANSDSRGSIDRRIVLALAMSLLDKRPRRHNEQG